MSNKKRVSNRKRKKKSSRHQKRVSNRKKKQQKKNAPEHCRRRSVICVLSLACVLLGSLACVVLLAGCRRRTRERRVRVSCASSSPPFMPWRLLLVAPLKTVVLFCLWLRSRAPSFLLPTKLPFITIFYNITPSQQPQTQTSNPNEDRITNEDLII